MKHYTVAELDTYNAGEMNILAKLRCTAHLKNCSECQFLLETVKSNDGLITQVQDAWAKLNPEITDSDWQKSYDRITKLLNKA